jgi:hypothetical protein
MNYAKIYYKNRSIMLNHNIDIEKQVVFLPGNRTLEEYMEV